MGKTYLEFGWGFFRFGTVNHLVAASLASFSRAGRWETLAFDLGTVGKSTTVHCLVPWDTGAAKERSICKNDAMNVVGELWARKMAAKVELMTRPPFRV